MEGASLYFFVIQQFWRQGWYYCGGTMACFLFQDTEAIRWGNWCDWYGTLGAFDFSGPASSAAISRIVSFLLAVEAYEASYEVRFRWYLLVTSVHGWILPNDIGFFMCLDCFDLDGCALSL